MSELYIPDGYREGLPKVEVSKKVTEMCGEAIVNYDGLNELYRRDLGLSPLVAPHLVMKELRGKRFGQHNPFRATTFVDPIKSNKSMGYRGHIKVLLHEGQHFADFSNRPLRAYGETILSQAVALGGGILGAKYGIEHTDVPDLISGSLGFMIGSNIAAPYLYDYSPLERRARKTERNQELLRKYQNVIIFPNFDRKALSQ